LTFGELHCLRGNEPGRLFFPIWQTGENGDFRVAGLELARLVGGGLAGGLHRGPDLLRRSPRSTGSGGADVLASDPHHHLPVVVVGEYRYGLLRSRHRIQLELLLQTLIHESIVLLVDEQTAERYAEVRDGLRRRGNPIPENDVWIAALARQHAQPVISRDTHFDLVEDVERIGW
jgi:tRNA(fMet)-specific endonuclease VapC